MSKLTSAAGPSRVDGPLARPIEGASAPPGGSEVREATSVGALLLDAEALYGELLRGVQLISHPTTRLVGVTSGGAWLAERLQRDLKLPGTAGTISSAMHRDDFAQRGLSAGGQTVLPFDVNGADILLLDDVLYTGRTLRAVINELFDYGRPAVGGAGGPGWTRVARTGRLCRRPRGTGSRPVTGPGPQRRRGVQFQGGGRVMICFHVHPLLYSLSPMAAQASKVTARQEA